jgi:hypothetical protein
MSDPGGLQFDKAEPGGPSPAPSACFTCKAAIADTYFTVSGQILCSRCKESLEHQAAGGSRTGRFLKAILFGLGAALVGTVIYVIMLKTGYEIALVAILVGFMVGKAVRAGSGGRGGRAYQVLAVVLTYCSIVSGYVPMLLEGLNKSPPAPKEKKEGGEEAAPNPSTPAPAASGEKQGKAPGCLSLILALAVIFAVAAASPWLAGFENIIGWVIIFVALLEAWRLARSTPLVFRGPFRVATQPEGPPLA